MVPFVISDENLEIKSETESEDENGNEGIEVSDDDDDESGEDEESGSEDDVNEEIKEESDDENDQEIKSETESEKESGNEDNSDDEKDRNFPKGGWADAMQKVLKVNKRENNKTIILSKAKKLSMLKKPVDAEEEKEKNENENKTKTWITLGREKPNILNKEKERMLSKIAARGVVQLFNAVRKHRKTEDIKSDESVPAKKAKTIGSLDKDSFLSILSGENNIKRSTKTVQRADSPEIKSEDEYDDDDDDNDGASEWDVLKENFLHGTKLKNWDKAVN